MKKTKNQNSENLKHEAELESLGYFQWLKDKDGFEKRQREIFKDLLSKKDELKDPTFITIKILPTTCLLLSRIIDEYTTKEENAGFSQNEPILKLSYELHDFIMEALNRTELSGTIDLTEQEESELPF